MSNITTFRIPTLFTAGLLAALLSFAPAAQASSLSTNWNMASIWEGPGGSLAHHAPQQSRNNTTTADGRLAVFWSEAGNLVAGDTNNVSDIFIFDRLTKMAQRINLGAGGVQANGHTRNATISADGRYIGFTTLATNTAAGAQCVPGYGCAFSGVLDRTTGAITVGSKNSSGQLMPVTNGIRPIMALHAAIISGDGKSFLFSATSPADQTPDIFVRNLVTGEVRQANVNNLGERSHGGVYDPSISDDGRLIAFSTVSPLVPQDTNDKRDVYLRSVPNGTTVLISQAHQLPQAANGVSEAPSVSGNGQFVVFTSQATNLLPGGNDNAGNIFLHNLYSGELKQISTPKFQGKPNGQSFAPSISADGSHIVFASYAGNLVREGLQDGPDLDIFIHYRAAGVTRIIKLPPRSDVEMFVLGQPVVNANGKTITYQLYVRSQTNPAANAYGVYLNYDPVAHIPFYDPEDILDILL